MNLEQARSNMIEQQVRPWEVLDPRILDVFAGLPREEFVPRQWRHFAYADLQIPLGHGEVMMTPKVEGRLLQSLEVLPGDAVLEIGTGSGYLCACLARLGKTVLSVDIHADFLEAARARLERAGIRNVRLETGDACGQWEPRELYDAIAVTGALPEYLDRFERHLRVGGRLFAIVGEPPIMEAIRVTRTAENTCSRESLFETLIPPLRGAPHRKGFAL